MISVTKGFFEGLEYLSCPQCRESVKHDSEDFVIQWSKPKKDFFIIHLKCYDERKKNERRI